MTATPPSRVRPAGRTEVKAEGTELSTEYPGLQHQPDRNGGHSWLRRTIRRFLRTQFGRPAGLWGEVVGRIMARTPSNHERARWTVSLLEVGPRDRVLEVGFGPGLAIEEVSRFATQGFVAGLDHSEAMVRQAAKRNAKAVREGRVTLQLGSASKPPVFSEPFDKIFTINSIHFWTEPTECLGELRKLLRPGGRIAVTIQPRSRGATLEDTRIVGAEVSANLQSAGFVDCRVEIRETNPVPVACALGVRPSSDLRSPEDGGSSSS